MELVLVELVLVELVLVELVLVELVLKEKLPQRRGNNRSEDYFVCVALAD